MLCIPIVCMSVHQLKNWNWKYKDNPAKMSTVRWWELCILLSSTTLQWCHNESDGVSNHLHLDCLFSRLFGRRSKKTSKLRATGLCEGKSSVTGGFLSQRASKAENVSISWRHHVFHRYGMKDKLKWSGLRNQSPLSSLSPSFIIIEILFTRSWHLLVANLIHRSKKYLRVINGCLAEKWT